MNIKKVGLFFLLSLSIQQTQAVNFVEVVPAAVALFMAYPTYRWVQGRQLDKKYGRKSFVCWANHQMFSYKCVTDKKGEVVKRTWTVHQYGCSEEDYSAKYEEALRADALVDERKSAEDQCRAIKKAHGKTSEDEAYDSEFSDDEEVD